MNEQYEQQGDYLVVNCECRSDFQLRKGTANGHKNPSAVPNFLPIKFCCAFVTSRPVGYPNGKTRHLNFLREQTVY